MLEAPPTTLASKLGSAAKRAASSGAETGARTGVPSARKGAGSRGGKSSAKPAAGPARPDFGGTSSFRPGPDDFVSRRSPGGLRLRVSGGGVPRSLAGRIAVGLVLVGGLAGFTGSLWGARLMLLRDPRLKLPSSDAIEITGNSHLTKAQLLSVFGEDIDHNVLTVPLAERQAALEQLPWVEHAAVMRLLPDHLRVAITERTPVAFVRQGSEIGLIDAHGVLLEMTPGSPADAHYSFPVVTGISANDPPATREARMKLYTAFITSLDSGSGSGPKISSTLSDIDLSNPEDIKALPVKGSLVLVHFGDTDFLARYQRFEKHLPEWKAQYPRLASVDMRYERDVVLEMEPGASVPSNDAGATPEVAPAPAGPPKPLLAAPLPKAKKPVHPLGKKLEKPAAKGHPAVVAGKHSEVAFDAPARHPEKHRPAAKPKHPAQGRPR